MPAYKGKAQRRIAAERRPGYASTTHRRLALVKGRTNAPPHAFRRALHTFSPTCPALSGNAVKQIFAVFLGYLQRKQLDSLPCKRKQCYYTAIQRRNLLHSVAFQGKPNGAIGTQGGAWRLAPLRSALGYNVKAFQAGRMTAQPGNTFVALAQFWNK